MKYKSLTLVVFESSAYYMKHVIIEAQRRSGRLHQTEEGPSGFQIKVNSLLLPLTALMIKHMCDVFFTLNKGIAERSVSGSYQLHLIKSLSDQTRMHCVL